jgi:NADH-quinone oxidoreductase subunit E
VATFYTFNTSASRLGEYHVGVCTDTLCAVMGGERNLSKRSKIDLANSKTNEVASDGKVSVEHIECNAACDHAPVVMANWEFYDNQPCNQQKI